MSVRKRLLGVAAVMTAAGVLGAPAVSAAPAEPGASGADHGHRATQRAMDRAVASGVPGVTGQAVDPYGQWTGTSGIGDLRTRASRGAYDHFRVGSITKTFTAVVLLQLAAEGKVGLDDTVGEWLPGVVEGHGHDGDRITVRQLLNHTSGIYDYLADPEFQRAYFSPEFMRHRFDTRPPEHWVRLAMRHRPQFPPGTAWGYSNTNYLLAGMIVERATGHSYADEIRARVIEPLGLRHTSVPGTRPTLPRPSSRAYSKLFAESRSTTYDVTELNPSEAGAAGEMISSSADLNRFYRALLDGRLLPDEQLSEMKETVPATDLGPGVGYGLGLMRLKLSCGTAVWGHGGGIQGSQSEAMATGDGRRALAFNLNGDWTGDLKPIVEAEFCAE
ncbi:serine hydrolase domain-containing protein [Streptomyces flavofungini]|uniref:Beta-lactamase family protein n=1 Tax=Streptomyces flavofungini TaxID=68200 RepID=A0ABS0XDR8_9ACTN|nr:serine hydrolase domain-containing protein [Streptomyces flavofungini]MBJ3811368.1 beta-lactamase family protein [Streptomyces flavofungini]GHC42788.1 D-alanyl-D-alanine carboxypeptidase [Streptomyces flavofungini]